jgi:hypothetical protein
MAFKLTFVLCLVVSSSFAQSDFQTTIKNLLKKDFPKYQWRNIPLNNYGVATSYAGPKPQSSKLQFLCGTYAFFGIKKIPANADSLMRPSEIIETGCSPALNATIQLQKQSVFKAILPNIASLFGFSASVSDSLSRNAVVDELEICDRRLQEGAANSYIENLTKDPLQIQKNYINDNLIMVVRDVVIKKLKISIKTGSKLSSEFDLKLLGKLKKVVGDSSQLSMQLKKLSNTSYEMEITTPVVAGYLAVKKGKDSRGEIVKQDESKITGWGKEWMITPIPAPKDTPLKKKKSAK